MARDRMGARKALDLNAGAENRLNAGDERGLVRAVLGSIEAAPGGSTANAVSLTAGGLSYTQDFNTLATSGTSSALPANWAFLEAGSSSNLVYTANAGSSTTGDTYSYGTGTNTDRALGGLASNNLTTSFGASFTNNSGSTITSLAISYTGELWRLNDISGRLDRLDFQYSLTATGLSSPSWIDVDQLDFNTPNTTGAVGARDGNATGFNAAISFTISSLNIAAGTTFWIRWVDPNVTGNDDGLAIDDFSMTATIYHGPAVANPIPDLHLDEDTALNFAFAANAFSDPDGDTLTYGATLDDNSPLPGWLTFAAATRTFSGTPPPDFNGTLHIKVTASDASLTVSDTFDLIVDPVNDDPVIANLDHDSVTFVEGGVPIRIDAGGDALVTDVDSADFGGGSLAVIFIDFTPGEDVVTFATSPETGITLSNGIATGSMVSVGGIAIGTITTGIPTSDAFSIDFNVNAHPADVSALMRALTYQNVNDANPHSQTRAIAFILTDDGLGPVNALTEIHVTRVNDAPVNAVPGGQAIDEDGSLVLAGANAISVSDVDAASAPLRITLVVTHGTLTLAGTSGLSFVTGDGSGDAAMTFTGTAAAINAALDGLTYVPAADYHGADAIQLTTSDQGAMGTGGALTDSDTIAITIASVNDAPGGQDWSVALDEDVTYTFTIFDFPYSDPDNNGFLAVKIATLPAAGTLLLNGIAVQAGDSISSSQIFAGQLTFQPAPNGNGAPYASFTFQFQDNGGTANGGVDLDPIPNTMSIEVNAVNDAPVTTAPGPISLNEDATVAIAGVQVSDIEAGLAGAPLFVLLSANSGSRVHVDTSIAGGVGPSGVEENDSASVTITGTQAQINATLAAVGGLTYTPPANFNGTGTIIVTTSDLGSSGSGGARFDTEIIVLNIAPVNDAPVGADATRSIAEDASYTFAAANFGFTDPVEGHAFLSVIVATLPANGTLTLSGNPVTAGQEIPAGSIGNLVFTPAPNANGSGYGNFTFQVRDNGGVANGGQDIDQSANLFTLNVTAVNDAPALDLDSVAAGTGSTGTYAENDPVLIVAPTGTMADPDLADFAGGALTVTMSGGNLNDSLSVVNEGNGAGQIGVSGDTISYGGIAIGTASGGTNTIPLTISLNAAASGAAVQALMRRIGFASAGENPLNHSPSLSFKLTDGDGGTSNTAVAAITVLSVNDAPSGTDKAVTINEDGTVVFSLGNFGFSDAADGNSFAGVLITTLPTNGTLYSFGNPITHGNYFVAASLIGSGNLLFQPAANGNGAPYASFTFQVRDNGGTANGGIDTDPTPNTMTINVNSINDAPFLDNIHQDFVTYLEGNGLVLLDTDAPATLIDDNVNYAGGTLSIRAFVNGNAAQDVFGFAPSGALGGGAGVVTYGGVQVATYTGGSGGVPLLFSFSADATQAAVQALMRAISYTNSAGDNTSGGTRVIEWLLIDGGGTALGGGDRDDAVSYVEVIGVNDAPTLAATAQNPTYAEDSAAVDLYSAVSASTVETDQSFTAMTLTVTSVTDGSAEILVIDGSSVALTNGNAVTTAAHGLAVSVSLSGGTATVGFTGAALSSAQMQALVDSLAYRNSSQNPTDANRVVTITQIVDSGDTGGVFGSNASAPNLAATIDVDPVNDAPAVDLNGDGGGLNHTGGFTENGAGVAIGSAITVSDIDTGDLIESATVTLTNAEAGDTLTAGTLPPGISLSTAMPAGQIVLIFSGAASASVYAALLADIRYANSSENPVAGNRAITVTVGDGAIGSATATATIAVTAVDDAAVARNDAFTTDEATAIGGGSVFADNGAGADSDVDGPALAVAAVNGVAAGVGTQITLLSGALLTLNANGTFVYNPNGAFNSTPTPGSGAANTPAHDNFTYTLTGGGTATVNVTITGIDSNDLLNGTAGADVLAGGAGNDTYGVDGADIVIEAAGQGFDVVYASASFALGAGAEVEILSVVNTAGTIAINLTGNEFGQTIIGNAGNNFLIAGGGADGLYGGLGDDTYSVDTLDAVIDAGGNDIIYSSSNYALNAGSEIEILSANDFSLTTALNLAGNEFGQSIFGNAGDNFLIAGGGADGLYGGLGNDTYSVDTLDIVVDAGGFDIIYSSTNFQLNAGAEIEILSVSDFAATTPLNLTGNERDQQIFGNAGDNFLIAGAGADGLYGKGGNDTYSIDSQDVVVENVGEGFDTLYTSTSFILGAGTEIEVISANDFAATAPINLVGNEFAQQILGNAGANTLNGGAGSDSLGGGGGADTFAFTTTLGATNVDTILDFASGTDRVALDHAIFTALGVGPLSAGAFVVGTAAGDADDRIVYDSATGQLRYDADGNGAGAAILFATLNGHPAIAAGDFIVI